MRFLALLLVASILLPVFVTDAEAGRRHRKVVYRTCPTYHPGHSYYYPTTRYYATPRYYTRRPVLRAAAIAATAAYAAPRYYRYGYPRRSVRIVRRY